ncbi:hypothetical protein NVS55_01715 [Myxococcus stipitatus]|uniref:hypothetical protein n=1 Tax=Myxococcus stipitatus TaxID=83455 RepID=UPI0031454D1B
MTSLVDGVPQTALISSATLRISSPSRDIKALNLQVGALNCPGGIEARLASGHTFKVIRASCPVPTDSPSCASLLELNDGWGTRETEGNRVELSLKGTLTVTCGATPAVLPVTVTLNGTHTGAALPDTVVDSLAEHPDLSTLVQTLSALSRE